MKGIGKKLKLCEGFLGGIPADRGRILDRLPFPVPPIEDDVFPF